MLRRKHNDWPNCRPSAARPKQKRSSEPKQNNNSTRELRPCARQKQNSSSASRKPQPVSAKPKQQHFSRLRKKLVYWLKEKLASKPKRRCGGERWKQGVSGLLQRHIVLLRRKNNE